MSMLHLIARRQMKASAGRTRREGTEPPPLRDAADTWRAIDGVQRRGDLPQPLPGTATTAFRKRPP